MFTDTRGVLRAGILLALVVLTGCSEEDSPTGIDPEEAALLALDEQDGTREFGDTRACPAGGTMTVAGTVTRSTDASSGAVTFSSTVTRSFDDCVRTRDTDEGTFSLLTDGSMTTASVRHLLDRRPTGIWTITRQGTMSHVPNGVEARICENDLTITIDTTARTRTVEGIACGEPVSESGDWNPRAGDRGDRMDDGLGPGNRDGFGPPDGRRRGGGRR